MEVRNRFKGLDLIDRVPDELWMEDHDRDQDHPQVKEMKKAKQLSNKAFQIVEKRRKLKAKGKRNDILN